MVLRDSLITLVVLLMATPVLADAPCFDSFTKGQELVKTNKLLEARSEFSTCVGDATCPAPPLIKDCQSALDGVNARIGSIVIATSQPMMDAAISVDGVTVAHSLDGRAIDLDPGVHRVELKPAHGASTTREVLVTEGEKLKRVSFDVVSTPASPPIVVRSSPPYAAWTFGALGVGALGAFAIMAATGQSTYDGCQNLGCSSGTFDSLRTERVAAWVTFGVGVAALVTSTVLFLTHRHSEKKVAFAPAWLVRF